VERAVQTSEGEGRDAGGGAGEAGPRDSGAGDGAEQYYRTRLAVRVVAAWRGWAAARGAGRDRTRGHGPRVFLDLAGGGRGGGLWARVKREWGHNAAGFEFRRRSLAAKALVALQHHAFRPPPAPERPGGGRAGCGGVQWTPWSDAEFYPRTAAISEAMAEVEGWTPWKEAADAAGEEEGEGSSSGGESGGEGPDPFEVWLRKRRWRVIEGQTGGMPAARGRRAGGRGWD